MEKRKSTQDLFRDLKKLAIEGDTTALMGIATLASKDSSGLQSLIEIAREGNKEAVSHLLTLISEGNSKAKEGLKDVIIETDKRTFKRIIDKFKEAESISSINLYDFKSIFDNNINKYLIDLAINGDTEAMKLLSNLVNNREVDVSFTYASLMVSVKNNPFAYECIETILRSEYNSDVNSILLELYMGGSILAYASLHTLADEGVFMAVRDVFSLGLADNSHNEFNRFIELVKSGMPTAAVIARDIIKNSADQYDVEIVDCIKKALSESVNKSDETIELLATLADSGKGSK